MSNRSLKKFTEHGAFTALVLSFALFSHSAAGASACPSPKGIPDLTPPTCTEKDKPGCDQCKAEFDRQKSNVDKFRSKAGSCQAIESACLSGVMNDPKKPLMFVRGENGFVKMITWINDFSCQKAMASDQVGTMTSAQEKALKAAGCYKTVKDLSDEANSAGKECANKIRTACDKVPDGKKEADKCQKGADEAKKKAEEAKKKEEDAKKNADKNGDNAKKEGGMPQMPQIPQMPQEKEDKPQDLATSPTPDSTVASSTAPQIETSKFDDGKSDLATPQIGFGLGTNTNTHVGLTPNQAFPVQSYATENAFRTPSTNGLGENGNPSTVAASSPAGGGGGGGGGGSGNTSGSSRPGEGGDTAKGPDAANPYEVAVGSGGRLGVPKGKSSTDADSPIDAAATANFNGDFKVDPQAGEQTAGAAEEEEPGYTIFKMVKYRYSELKKKGNI